MIDIVIDPGHGGTQTVGGSSPNNAVGPAGTLEKSLTLAIGLRLRDLLVTRGRTVRMTRSSDVNLGLADRAHVARNNQARSFISIHLNGDANPSIQGTETWLHTQHSGASKRLGDLMQASLVAATGLRDRGVKSKALAVLNPNEHAPQTACCLAEISFLTDPVEEQRLLTSGYQTSVATALADALDSYLGPVFLVAEAIPELLEDEDGFAGRFTNTEAEAWASQENQCNAALAFWEGFFGLRMGPNGMQPLDDAARARLRTIARAVSWVESKHGTGTGSQPQRDPMQSGNPRDAWWKELTGQSGLGSRFVRHPQFNTNYWASELAEAAAAVSGFPAGAELAQLTKPRDGHRDAAFAPAHSYTWGLAYLLHRINAVAGNDPVWRCDDLARQRLIEGAVAYNGGGDPAYRQKIKAALALIGGLDVLPPELIAQFAMSMTEHVSSSTIVAGLVNVVGGHTRVRELSVDFDRQGMSLARVELRLDNAPE